MQKVFDMLADSHTGENENTDRTTTSSSLSSRDDSSNTLAPHKKLRYKVLTEEKIRKQQKKDTRNVVQVLCVPFGVAEVLLRHCHWDLDRVLEGWCRIHGEDFRRAIGLPSATDEVFGPKMVRHGKKPCKLCLDDSSGANAGELMRSAGCDHYYCDGCWSRCILAAVDAGSCLSQRCPDTSCQVPVIRELVHMVADNATKERYDWYALRSYVDNSGGRIKWCQDRDCGRAIEFLGGDDDDSVDVFCDCSHGFCWKCGGVPHWPVSCSTAHAWLEKHGSVLVGDDKRYWDHYNLWETDNLLLQEALKDMGELKDSWLGNMAAALCIKATDLDFLTEAYEEIIQCRRIIPWVDAYGYFLDPDRDWAKCQLLDHQKDQAIKSLKDLQDFDEKGRVELCTAEDEHIIEMFSTFKTKLMELTRETQQRFEELVKQSRPILRIEEYSVL